MRKKVFLQSLFFVVLFCLFSKSVFAFTPEPYATNSAVVSATVLSQHFNPPTLIAPQNNSVTSNTREPLVWKRPSPVPVTPLHHYDLYLDGRIFASQVSDSIVTQTYYFYTISRQGDTFYLYLNTDLAQGYHTWYVVANNTFDISAASDTYTFYIDSYSPNIKLQKVDRQTLNWDTADPQTIPGINLRDLSVTTPDPLLTGTVEPYANMQIVLICPQNIRSCSDQTYLGNYPSGTWQHRFYGLIKGAVYTVYISATDAAGNTVIFPQFYLAYGVKTPFPTAAITPTVTPTIPVTPSITPPIPPVSPTITPIITPEVTPTPFIPIPPVSPTPPIYITQKASPISTVNLTLIIYLLLIVFGLPLHLALTAFGAKINFISIPHFLYVLFLPFIGNKPYQATPFTTINLYDPNKLDAPWFTAISDIKGYYQLKSGIPEKLFTKVTATGRIWKDIIIPQSILAATCLFAIKDSGKPLERLRQSSLAIRLVPLIIACFTSAYCLIIQPSYFYLTYLYLSLHLLFTEYIYPRISKG